MYHDTLMAVANRTISSSFSSSLIYKPFKPYRCVKASFYITENRLDFPTTKGFRTKIPTKFVYQFMAIFFNF